MPTVVEFAPENKVVEFTEEAVTAEVVVGPTVVEFSWGELVPEPGLSGGGPFEGRVYIRPDIPTLPTNSEPVDPNADYIMLWDASGDQHVKVLAALGGGGGGGGVEFATREETDAGIILDKALNPDVGAYAYDRFRHVGQHSAGKGTASVVLTPVSGVITIDQALSNVFETTLSQNVVFANPINPIGGQTVNILVRQNLTGGFTGTFGTAWTFTNKSTPAFTTTPGAVDLLSCQWDSSAGKMRATLLPNFGAGFTSPSSPGDFTFTNVGGANEVFKEVVGNDARFRTLVGTGDVSVTTEGDVISIAYTTPAALTPTFYTLPDVLLDNWTSTQFLRWDGEKVVTAELGLPDMTPHTYLTTEDETAELPNSRRFVAGDNISLDYSVPGELTISTGGPGGTTVEDGVEISRVAAQVFTHTIAAAVSFDTVVRDDSGYYDPAFPTRLTVPFTGWYVFSASMTWSYLNTSANMRRIYFVKNGDTGTFLGFAQFSSGNTVGASAAGATAMLHYCNAGDYFEVWGRQDSGNNLNVTPARFAIHRMGVVGPMGPIGPPGPAGPALDDGTFLRRLVDDTALGNYTFENIAPRLIFKETDAASNNRRWDIHVDAQTYKLRVLAETDGVVVEPNYITNHRAQAMTGWTTLTGNPYVVNGRCPPVLAGTGTNGFWGGTSASSSMRQRLSFSSFPADISTALIDTGSSTATMSWWGGSWVQGNYDKPRILLRFLNAALAEIGTFDTGIRNVADGGTFGSYYWTHYDDVFTIPALTRHIDVDLIFTRTAGTNNDATITDVVFTFASAVSGQGNVYSVTRAAYRPVNIDFETDTVTHNGVPLSELGHGHDQFGKTYGACWRTSDGSALSVANCQIVYVSVPSACSINEVIVLTEGGVGSCIVDVWKDTYANYPPTVADAITGLTKPTIISDTKTRDEELNGWTREIAAGDVLAFKVQSTSTFSTIQIQLKVL
jgi:hypothetical protein